MKVVFVSSGKSGKISPIVKAQGNSLKETGIKITYFVIEGRGVSGYLKYIFRLKKYIQQNNYDIIHAHYSLSGFAASLSGAKNVVVSLMGDDVLTSRLFFVTKLFAKYRWKKAIVKSVEMRERLGVSDIEIIPNGVNLKKFKALDKQICQEQLGFKKNKTHLLFAANPQRKVKNFDLFRSAGDFLKKKGFDIETHYLENVLHKDISKYMNAADVVCLSSFSEGSPNVIKEAMACNRPIVSTDVGDVKWLIDDLDGCYISTFDKSDYASYLEKALRFSVINKNTTGRERLIELGLDSKSVTGSLVEIYKNILN